MKLAAKPFWLVILSLGVTGSIVGAVVVAVASALNDRSRRRFELRKWRADFYIRPQLEALRNLHAAMVHSHYEINMRAKEPGMPKTYQEYQEQVKRPAMDFFRALNIADIYLDSDTNQLMHAVLAAVRQMTTSIEERLPENLKNRGGAPVEQPAWQPFTESYDAAHARLRHLLNPHELDELIRGAENDH